VNLANAKRPGDVYTAILKLVLKDIKNEKDEKYKKTAKQLEKIVKRKVIK